MYVPLPYLRSKGKASIYTYCILHWFWNVNETYAHLTVQYTVYCKVECYTIPVLTVSYKTSDCGNLLLLT